MILIIGGAHQGKTAYALSNFAEMTLVDELHLIILQQLREDKQPASEFAENIERYRNSVIVCDDISCGVVPTDPLMRRWREEVGRVLALAASQSDTVIRMFCGIPTVIKEKR